MELFAEKYMAIPPTIETADLWQRLNWRMIPLTPGKATTRPLIVSDCPDGPGLYRMYLNDPEWWARASDSIPIKASGKIRDRLMEKRYWHVPVLLTVGRTTSLCTRLEQHFGCNPNNNRIMKRLLLAFPNLTEDEIRGRVPGGISVEVVEVGDWVERFLLERYGCSITKPYLDFEAEH